MLYDENDIEGNVSATYTSKKGKIHTYFVPVECAIRVVTCLDGGYNLPSLEPIPTEKKSDCYMTQLGMAYKEGNFGSGYFLTLEDGSFIVVDGGGDKAEDYEKFYAAALKDVEEAKKTREYGLDMVNHPNWFDASFISWLSYDSLHLELPDGNLYFAPIINWGKYREENGRLVMPVTVRLNHAIADGYLVANVFRLLEQEIRCFVGL